jgi:multidrug transporter EmrE-like cation transporter
MWYFLAIVIVSVIEYIGDVNFKFFAREGLSKYLITGLAAYGIMISFVIKLLRQSNVVYLNGIWDSTSSIIESILAMVVLGERLTNTTQYAGLIFSILGTVLLNVGKIPY